MTLPVPKPTPMFAWLLGAALALGVMPSAANPGPMQVEEPDAQSVQPPIRPDEDKEGWQTGKNATLTASQKAALEARHETMKDMMALIQQKRLAIREARPEDRQALTQELHTLIVEQAQGADRARSRPAGRKVAKPDPEGSVNARTRGTAWDQMGRVLDQKAERLRQQELHRQQVEEKLRQAEDKSSGGASGGKKAAE